MRVSNSNSGYSLWPDHSKDPQSSILLTDLMLSATVFVQSACHRKATDMRALGCLSICVHEADMAFQHLEVEMRSTLNAKLQALIKRSTDAKTAQVSP